MTRPVIFLDCDGVLNTYATFRETKPGSRLRDPYPSEDDLVARLQGFCIEINAIVCVSSTWRKLNERRDIIHYLGHWLRDYLPQHASWRTPCMPSGFRGSEVAEWFQMYPHRTGLPHVIFDDDGDFYPDQPLVKVNPEFGLTDDNIQMAREMLAEQGWTP